jgi:hypothetical protein
VPVDAPAERGLDDLTLVEWNRRLERHFEQLAERRAVSGWPVFALEHGLSTDEVDALERAIHLALARHESPSLRAFLPWIVYATEFGYRYRGDEYWQSFAKETPGWNDRWREFIRESFRRFAKVYHGAKPEGAWAGNFTIICWPITHGVLPQDLQRQLARLLYDARFSLRPELFATALALGTHLRGLSQNVSARFREFSENALLLGQIAAALLVQEPEQELLSSDTLHRIVEDITRERAAAEWLKEARSSAHRLRVRGLSSRLGALDADPGLKSEAEESKAARDGSGKAIRARFLLRPRTETEWDVLLELPDLAPIQRMLPTHQEALARSRSRVTGAAAKVLARGRLLGSGSQRIAIESWPEPNVPLLSLEDGTAELAALLNSSLRSPPGDSVLFRIAVDGLGYAQKERSVRPGSAYVLLRKAEVERPVPEFQKISLTCAGIHGLKFTVPDTITELWGVLLANLELSVTRTLHVWPAGLCPVAWDGEGEATWLERDEILLGVRSDHSVDALEISFGGGVFRSFPVGLADTGGAQFVSLGRIPAGTYQVTLRTASAKYPEQPTGRLNLRVIPERSLSNGSSSRQPVALSCYPAVPALEDVWEGRAQLQLRGPATLDINCCVRLRSRQVTQDLYTRAITRIRLPLEPDEWEALFDRHVRKDEKAQEIIDSAHEICIEFTAGAHGSARLSAEREFTPLRWTVRRDAGVPLMCLLDDGGSSLIRSHYRAMDTPDRSLVLAEEAVERGCKAPFPGGLFVATDGARSTSAVFVPPAKALALTQLRVTPSVAPHPRDPAKLRELFQTAAEWQAARTKGSALAVPFRRQATQAILAEACGVIGGESWLRAEHSWRADEGARAIQLMKDAVSSHADERNLAQTIIGRAPEWALMDPAERLREFSSCVRRTARCLKHDAPIVRGKSFVESFGQRAAALDSIVALCAFALCAAGSPLLFAETYSTAETERGIQELLDKPIIMRFARVAVVTVHLARQKEEPNATLYAGWAR